MGLQVERTLEVLPAEVGMIALAAVVADTLPAVSDKPPNHY